MAGEYAAGEYAAIAAEASTGDPANLPPREVAAEAWAALAVLRSRDSNAGACEAYRAAREIWSGWERGSVAVTFARHKLAGLDAAVPGCR